VLLRMLVAGDTRRTQYACQSSEVCGTAAAPDNSMLMAMLGMNVTITTPPATNATAAANANNAVTDPDNCIDQDAYCKTLAHCTDCVGAKGYACARVECVSSSA
jgi:Flp pilus assembly protein TadG